jgi:Ca2+-binding RTX toxin-like protein
MATSSSTLNQPATLTGTSGDDKLIGTAANELVLGLAGNDTLAGGSGSDTLDGGAGNDLLWTSGHYGKSVLLGGEGDDTLRSVVNRDIDNASVLMTGGAGRDVYQIDGTAGWRTAITISADAQDSIVVDNFSMSELKLKGVYKSITPDGTSIGFGAGSTSVGVAHADLLGNVTVRTSIDGQSVTLAELIDLADLNIVSRIGSDGADVLTGGQNQDMITGLLGNDTLRGMAGDDTLFGGGGDDLLEGGAGNDSLEASAGNDTLLGGEGNDTLMIGIGGGTQFAGADKAVFDGGAGADRFVCQGDEGRSLIHADGQDTVAFQLYERAHMDVGRLGAEGADTLVLSLGLGVPAGVAGQTKLVFDHASTLGGLTFEWADGSTTAWEAILAESRQPMVNQSLAGTSSADRIVGGAGQDTLTGLAGDDFLSGGGGNDSILGGLGADDLIGGLGNDTLVGDKGNDTYEFFRGDGHDTLIDKDSTWFNSDALKISGATSSQLWFTRTGNSLDIAIIGTADKVTVQDWFASSANRIEKITALGDNKTLNLNKLNNLVTAMAGFTAAATAGTDLPANTPKVVTQLIATSWTAA